MEWFILGYFSIGFILFLFDVLWIERKGIVSASYRQNKEKARNIILQSLALSAIWPLTIMILCIAFVQETILIDKIEDAIIYIITRPIDLIIVLATKIDKKG